MTDPRYREALAGVRSKYLDSRQLPASTLLVVAGLALPEYLLEIEAIAVVEEGSGAAPRPGQQRGRPVARLQCVALVGSPSFESQAPRSVTYQAIVSGLLSFVNVTRSRSRP